MPVYWLPSRETLVLGLLVFSGMMLPLHSQVHFSDVTQESGINFVHNNGAFGKKYLPETMGSGAAFLDYDRDGWLDIFLANGMSWPDGNKKKSLPALYRNNGNGTFSDRTEEAGLATAFYGMGVAAADYDNDGDTDIYVASLGPDRLFQNQGDGTFRDRTKESGLDNSEYGTSCAFFDYDRDGQLDLFVANYVKWTRETDIFCSLDGKTKSYCTPEAYHGSTPRLFRNLGNGSFRDVTTETGIFDESNKGLGVLIFDFNNDGWQDIMLANDTQPNKLWENQGNGRFNEVGVLSGVAFSEDGKARGAMGIDAGDYDRSGFMSVLIGNFSNEMLSLYHNEQAGFFIDDAPTSTVGPSSLLTLTFGCFFFDYNLDGLLDIFTINGHVENEINRVQSKVTYRQPAHLFENLDGRRFKEVTADVGPELSRARVGRGAAYGDYDNDGDLDILITTSGASAVLLRNDGGNRNNWISFKLEGEESNRDGIGALVTLRSGSLSQTAQVRTGSSYCSQSQLRLTFGLGDISKVDAVEIRWPGAGKQLISDGLRTNSILRIHESRGIVNEGASLSAQLR